MEKIHINRLKVIGIDKISDKCPKIVIEFLAKSLGFKIEIEDSISWWDLNIEKVIFFIEKEHNNSVSNLDLRDIALFINPIDDIIWNNSKTLMKSFHHIHEFNPRLPIKNLALGNKSEENPYNIDLLMMYQICINYDIETDRNTTYIDLCKDINDLNISLTPIRLDLMKNIFRMSRESLIQLKRKLSSPTTDKSPKFPIDICKEKFRVDLSESKYISEELKILDNIGIEDYIPFDVDFRKTYLRNPHYYRYDKRYHCEYEYSNESLKNRLFFLNGDSEDSDTLVLGIHPLFNKEKTCIYNDEINTLNQYDNYLSTKDYVISRKELYDYWEDLYIFNSPCKPSVEFSFSHLKMILRTGEGPLNDLIYKIQANRKERIDNGYCSLLNNLDISKLFLKNIIEIGFIMRGYKTCYDEYPLSGSTYDSKYQVEVEAKTSYAIYEFMKDKEFIFISNKLPVLTCKNILGEGDSTCEIKTYDKSLMIYDIIDRIINKTESIDSCMRTNSNYLLITGWYYMKRVFDKIDFDIKDLSFVV